VSSLLHHVSALGWGWVLLFAALDLVTIASAIFAVVLKKRQTAIRALLIGTGATLASIGVAALAVQTGLNTADSAQGIVEPSDKARVMAEGLSVAMNGTAFGIVSTLVAGVATLVCLFAVLAFPEKPRT
jgi:hypothetical protein